MGGVAAPRTALYHVTDTIDTVTAFARDAFNTATELLERIDDIVDIGAVNTDVEMEDIELPNISSYLGEIPIRPDLGDLPEQPPLVFDFSESPYTSNLGDLLDPALRRELTSGSTGLTATVEDDIYARASERDLQALEDEKARLAAIWAETNAPMPDACLYALQAFADRKYTNTLSDKARDVRIESFKRAEDNARFVKELSQRYETVIREYTGRYWERQLGKAQSVLDYGVKVYDALIRWKGALIELYKGEAQAYEAQARGVAAIAGVQVAIYDSHTRHEVARAGVIIEGIKAQIALLTGKVNASINAAGNIGQVAAHLASGALSALHAGASVSYGGTESTSDRTTESNSVGYNETHRYTYEERP